MQHDLRITSALPLPVRRVRRAALRGEDAASATLVSVAVWLRLPTSSTYAYKLATFRTVGILTRPQPSISVGGKNMGKH
jgi:hypothetical protein